MKKALLLILIVTALGSYSQNNVLREIVNKDSSWVCRNDSALFSAGPAAAYEWFLNEKSTGVKTRDAYFNQEGNYYCKMTIEGKTAASNTLTLHLINTPQVHLKPVPAAYVCPGVDSVQLIGSRGGTRNWYFNGEPIKGLTKDTIWVKELGHYNMIKTNRKGCGDSAKVGIHVMPVPEIEVKADIYEICKGDRIQLKATPGADKYRWYKDGELFATDFPDSIYVYSSGLYSAAADYQSCYDSTDLGILISPRELSREDPCQEGQYSFTKGPELKLNVNSKKILVLDFERKAHVVPIQVEILNEKGEIVFIEWRRMRRVKTDRNFDLSQLPTGKYTLRLNIDQQQSVQQFEI
ncbi:MAG: hypothetical protein MI810_19740 [Flavobacteriales bacterium]|nr:hypothetical protein [Flavobacteriales bacterium]